MPSNPRSWRQKLLPTAHRLILEAKIAQRLPRLTGSVLVLGAGHDPYRSYLSSASDVITTDISDEYGLIDQIADAHNLPFDDAVFDCVVANEVFEHLTDPVKACDELFRVLKPGGRAVISIPFMFHVHGDPFDFTRFTGNGLHRLFREFSSVSIEEMGARIHVISDILTTAYKPLALFRLGNHVFRIPWLRNISSRDCASGYWVEAIK